MSRINSSSVADFFYLPYNGSLVEKARELRKNMTPAERRVWYRVLRDFPYRVLRQRPIMNYIVDFYCPTKLLVIEIDGDSHFVTEEAVAKDQIRDEELRGLGLEVVRFSNADVMERFDGVREALYQYIE